VDTIATLSWPAITSLALQQSPDLSKPNWTAVTNTPTLTGSTYQVTQPLSPDGMFYRLVLR
jgi:hypothetical protein